MIYDVIIIGAGASGLFAGICLDKNLKKIILEKTDKPGVKVLLSGGERANVTNINIDSDTSYFTQNKKFLKSIFSKYNQWDFMNFCSENGISLVEEDRGRMILESSNSKELVDLFLKKIRENNCELSLNSEVIEIKPHPNPLLIPGMGQAGEGTEGIKKNIPYSPSPLRRGQGGGLNKIYQITTTNNQKYFAKNIIISTGGKSFFQVGTTGDGYNFAEEFGLNIIPTFPGLCGITTKRDLSKLSGISTNLFLKLIDNKTKKNIYSEKGPILFTHFGLSGPIIFNTSIAIGEYLSNIENNFEKYLSDNLQVEIEFDLMNLPKKIIKFFELDDINNKVILELHSLRSWKEAKITTGGIDLDELDNHMQTKKQNGLFFVGEIVDITGKTGGFNLQWAWSSSFVACDFINKKPSP